MVSSAGRRSERGKTIDHHRCAIPLALVESVEPFDDFIVCISLNHQQIIAHIRSSHRSYHVLVPQQRSLSDDDLRAIHANPIDDFPSDWVDEVGSAEIPNRWDRDHR